VIQSRRARRLSSPSRKTPFAAHAIVIHASAGQRQGCGRGRRSRFKTLTISPERLPSHDPRSMRFFAS